MTTDLHTLLAPYSLDALEPPEAARFETHLEQCSACQSELAGFRATAARLGDAVALTPPATMRSHVLSEIARTPQDRPVVTAIAARRSLRSAIPRLAAAAAFLVGTIGVGGYAIERDNAHEADARSTTITSVLAAPDAATTSKTFSTGGNVRLVASPAKDSAVIVANDLARLKGHKVYQVWMVNGAGPKSQGTFTRSGTMIMHGAGGADSVAITVEPEGGSKQPTTAPIVTIAI
ncbi:hypothetical protein ASC61_03940 [Aeromicrobium sp. Root344]|uniref:anti-sigma factor n=1 Tax=Aeromicrobium sp. Root344 TaxID=1736521 RepID=UPI0006FC6562|nr:anti-sigma factor [Aeromicrobium sp. Root344]KQV74221.1 hypothetical protein ASC61_03940 [Aeromicrobium sp. Root344]